MRKKPVLRGEIKRAQVAAERWSVGSTIGSNPEDFKKLGKSQPKDAQQKKLEHIMNMHKDGLNYAQIGKVYRLDRSNVRKLIIKELAK